jgi:GntR family transcriptional regulator, gluconate operon transcriptional repressor
MALIEKLQLSIPQNSQLWESVLSCLRVAIITGQLEPQTHLVETEIAQKLNVSRGPVREALVRLEQEGLVVNQPYRGRYVADISSDFISEVYGLRLQLENYALELVSERLQPEHLAHLQELLDRMIQEATAAHVEEFAAIDLEFHRLLVTVSGHKLLLQMWETLTNVSHAFIALNASTESDLVRIITQGHQSILEALVGHDVAAAKESLGAHLAVAENRILEMMERN